MTDQMGKQVFTDKWEIYRQDAGMGEFDYAIFHNDNYFARTDTQVRAITIIKAIQRMK